MNFMKSLYEGLLGDDIFSGIDKAISIEWLNDHVKSEYKAIQLKTGKLKVRGKLIIRNVDELGFLNIETLNGDLYIERCGCTDISRIFAPNATVNGNISITGCTNLNDITGLPYMVDGNVVISNCPALKSLDGVKCLAGEVQIMKCGKRFSKATVAKAFPAAVNIFCSEEEVDANLNEAYINESFQDPILIRLYKQIQDAKQKFRIREMFGTGLKLDEITPSMRETFKMPMDEKDMLKAARKIVANRNRENGFIVTENWDGVFVDLYNDSQSVYHLTQPGDVDGWMRRNIVNLGNVNAILDRLRNGNSAMSDIRYVHIYKLSYTEIGSYKLSDERRASRAGAIDSHDPQQMKALKREQLDRYKKAVAALKATRNSDRYKEVVNRVSGLMERFTKFMNKIISDPKWAGQNSYKLDRVFDAFRKGYERGATYQNYGLIYAFQNWSSNVIQTINQETNYGNATEYAKTLQDAIQRADNELTKLGM